MLTLANRLSNMLFYLERWPTVPPYFPSPLSSHVLFNQEVKDFLYLKELKQHSSITVSQHSSTLSVMSEDTGSHVNMVFR